MYLWVIIDETPTFISENNEDSKLLAATLQTVLQKCRHARIGIILSAINPSRENLVIDLSPVAARICFRVAKSTNSVTILNEGGTEDLIQQGDMLFERCFENGADESVQVVDVFFGSSVPK